MSTDAVEQHTRDLAAEVVEGAGPAFTDMAHNRAAATVLEDATDDGLFDPGSLVPDAYDPDFFALAGSGLIRDPAAPGLYLIPADDLLGPLVQALVSQLAAADLLLRATPGGWRGAFDLDTTPDPAWLGRLIGTDVPGGLAVDEQRAYVQERAAWRRGTPTAFRAAIQATLTGSRKVEISERTTSPWRLGVRVYQAEVADEDVLRAAIASQKPVGIVVDLEIAVGATYAHMSADHGPSYTDLALDFPTYYDAYTHIPEEA